jgi:trehalose 6-phosphate synthase
MAAGSLQRTRLGPSDAGELFRAAFPGSRLVVVSNREPYEHRRRGGEIVSSRPAGGITSALDPLLQAVGGVWIAWGSGNADAEVTDPGGRVRVPPEAPRYTLRRIWLNRSEVRHYYLGFANQFLWPLFHLRPSLTRVRTADWEHYRRVNQRFAEAVVEETQGGDAAVWFHDYHLVLAPAYVRAASPGLALAHFWHIPWPPLDVFRIAPQAVELLEGLLANDLVGLHLPQFVENFLRCAQEILGAEVDLERGTAVHRGRVCHVRSFPISIDVDAFERAAGREGAEEACARVRARYAPRSGQLGIGVDRMDYSKGLPEKLKALDLLWERYPEFRERFSFVQIAVPSRTNIGAYDELTHEVERLVWEINDRWGTLRWRPVRLIKRALPPERLAILYRAADLCIVSSLQDGMNLVAKEFVASKRDGQGVLLLSQFAGAAEELRGALEVNPYAPEDFAQRIREALLLPAEERRARMLRMRRSLRSIYDWLGDVLRVWGSVADGAAGQSPAGSPALDAPGIGGLMA